MGSSFAASCALYNGDSLIDDVLFEETNSEIYDSFYLMQEVLPAGDYTIEVDSGYFNDSCYDLFLDTFEQVDITLDYSEAQLHILSLPSHVMNAGTPLYIGADIIIDGEVSEREYYYFFFTERADNERFSAASSAGYSHPDSPANEFACECIADEESSVTMYDWYRSPIDFAGDDVTAFMFELVDHDTDESCGTLRYPYQIDIRC